MYRCDKFNDLIYTGKVIYPVLATYQFLACRYTVRYSKSSMSAIDL
jgi:hypothetical protein